MEQGRRPPGRLADHPSLVAHHGRRGARSIAYGTRPDPDVSKGAEGFVLHTMTQTRTPTALQGRRADPSWIASLNHERSPDREACSVALGVDRAYAAAIPLRGSGRVRCSWDLATKINRWW